LRGFLCGKQPLDIFKNIRIFIYSNNSPHFVGALNIMSADEYVIPYIIGISVVAKKIGNFLKGQLPVIIFSGLIVAAMIYVSARSHHAVTTSQITTNNRGTMLTVPQSIQYQSLPIEQTIEKECYKNGNIPTKVIYNMIDFAKVIKAKNPSSDVGLGITLIKLATAREVMNNLTMTEAQLKTDTLMNVTASIRYLGQMVTRFNGDLKYGILAYYKGPGSLEKDIRNGTVSYALADKMLTERIATPAKKVFTYVAKVAKKPDVITNIPEVAAFDEIQKPILEPDPEPANIDIPSMTPMTPVFVMPNQDSVSINHKLDTIILNSSNVKLDTIARDVDSITTSIIQY
jgi:hypothetical protein